MGFSKAMQNAIQQKMPPNSRNAPKSQGFAGLKGNCFCAFIIVSNVVKTFNITLAHPATLTVTVSNGECLPLEERE